MSDHNHDQYIAERLQAIFSKQPPFTKPYVKTSRRETNSWSYFLGKEACDGLRSLVKKRNYLPPYLGYLAIHNTTYLSWSDTRPDELRAADDLRLGNGVLPLWTYGLDRVDSLDSIISICLEPYIIERFADLALQFGIGAQRYVVRGGSKPFEGIRSTPLEKLHLMAPRHRTSWFLRALGMRYITPHNTPTDISVILPWRTTRQAKLAEKEALQQ